MTDAEDPGLDDTGIPEGEEQPAEKSETKLIRLIKSITVQPRKGTRVDDAFVNVRFYNSFNYSLLSTEHQQSRLTIGITSPNRGEGKTLVASNLAVSLALGLQRKTVLVDFNFASPRLHRIFDVELQPGLTEALTNGQIHVSQTVVEHLSVLSAGGGHEFQAQLLQPQTPPGGGDDEQPVFSLGLDKLASFRDVIYSLEQEFDFVIVDMPSIQAHGVPVLFANQLNGLIIVVDSTKTKRKSLDAMYRQIDTRQVIGFVLNNFNE